jgi:hypothetical protein
MGDYEREEWTDLYKTAIVELEHAKMAGQISSTRNAITVRLEKLKTLPGLHSSEQHAIATISVCWNERKPGIRRRRSNGRLTKHYTSFAKLNRPSSGSQKMLRDKRPQPVPGSMIAA